MPEESTTPDLVELTRAIFEAMDRDWDIEALAAYMSPDIVWEAPEGMGDAHGVTEVRQVLKSWWAMWEDHHHHIQEVRDFGHGVVFVAVLEDGRPVGSEATVTQRSTFVYQWLDGKMVRIMSYTDPDEARAAAERLARERG
jgi:ketosteroid isomerase-like protein